MFHEPKFYTRIEFEIFTEERDRWIGLFVKRRGGQDSGCEFIETEHYVCIIPCVVLKFNTKRYTKHQKGCWHKSAKK